MTQRDREHWESELERLSGLSARQWGEDSDAGDPDGPRAMMLDEIAAALNQDSLPEIACVYP